MSKTFQQFCQNYPDEDSCLEYLFNERYGAMKWCPKCGCEASWYRVKGRKSYGCMHCRYQLHPLAGTIFHGSSTPLQSWFFALYLFSTSKNGVAAMELQRHLGVTYKCAWRIAKQIRLLMRQESAQLSGVVEADETYIGGRRRMSNRYANKTPVVGLLERGGKAKAIIINGASATTVMPYVKASIKTGSTLYTDESRIYFRASWDYEHRSVCHKRFEFVNEKIHTNSIEGFWGQLKRSLHGTYHNVSKKYLQTYVDHFLFLYNYRDQDTCDVLLARAAQPV